jgi:hypothetical protein
MGREGVTKKNQKRLLFLCGYAVFNVFVMVTCIRIFARIGGVFGLVNFGMGEALSNFLALLLPGPF